MIEFVNSFSKLEFPKILSSAARYAATDIGKKRIMTLRPFASVKESQEALDQVTEMVRLLKKGLQPSFSGILDIRTSIHHAAIQDHFLSSQELRNIANFLIGGRMLRSFFLSHDEEAPLLADLSLLVHPEKVLEYNISQAIDERGEVSDDASKELRRLRKIITELHDQLKNHLVTILKKAIAQGWAQEDLVTTRNGRMVIPIKVEQRQNIPGFVHSSSQSGATVFLEPTEVLELNNELHTFQFDEQREVSRILHNLTSQVHQAETTLLQTIEIIEYFDVVYAKGKYSIALDASAPQFGISRILEIRQARHPLLLELLPREKIEPLDLKLGEKYTALVITGPNAGGKTVALKTVGILSLMAQCGFHIPALPSSNIPYFDRYFVDIGDEQSIENNLSTFSSHIQMLRVISENVIKPSLVLLDEIVTGTDPIEGGAIGAAFLDELISTGCYIIATTHNSYLKEFVFETDGIENASMEFDQSMLAPTFRIRFGIPGRSYALEIASRLGLSQKMIQKARKMLPKENRRMEDFLFELDRNTTILQNKLLELNKDKARLDDLLAENREREEELKDEKRKARNQARDQVSKFLSSAEIQLQNVIREVRVKLGSQQSIKTAKKMLQDVDASLSEALTDPDSTRDIDEETSYGIGDKVVLNSGLELGEIVEVLNRNHFVVIVGSLRMKVTKAMISRKSNQAKKGIQTHRTVELTSNIHKEIDVRGLTGEEAMAQVDKFIDSSVLIGLSQIWIIHGKGTGALRRRLQTLLTHHSQVGSFRLGEWNEGGDGVTIVELK